MNIEQNLLTLAMQTAKNAYAPYSKFCVGAAILGKGGNYYSGCNVENISYPNGTCAETGAIAAMVAAGEKQIKEILIYADSKTLITPCGACLQRIAEFSDKTVKIHLANASGIQKTATLNDLFPNSFKEF